MPSLDEVPNGRGVLVKMLACGVDGTDKEIMVAEYGAPPPGYDFPVHSHENFGRVVAVGPNVSEFHTGDYVGRPRAGGAAASTSRPATTT